MQRNPPTSVGAKRFKIFYGTMIHNPPPKFVLFVNDKKLCPKNYLAYLENQLRQAFFPEAGLPIMLDLREREREPLGRGGHGRGHAAPPEQGAPDAAAHAERAPAERSRTTSASQRPRRNGPAPRRPRRGK